jgi:hypothetical protein
MNDRIDKLLVEAGAYFGGDGVVYDTFDPKKFAELIVRACALVAFKKAGPKTALDVLEHFGVEE